MEVDAWPTKGQKLIVRAGEITLLVGKKSINVSLHARVMNRNFASIP